MGAKELWIQRNGGKGAKDLWERSFKDLWERANKEDYTSFCKAPKGNVSEL